ncbi:MAG: hypothetical protein LBQ78_03065, partial [Tannerellaceae bacterium]|nr:hypothetical protein [Tannerellaceae bacterium]
MVPYKTILTAFVFALCANTHLFSQITERPRPAGWDQLVPGARFLDRFLPMPQGASSKDTWGAENVIPRFVDNGIEDSNYSYWGGNILRGNDGQY